MPQKCKRIVKKSKTKAKISKRTRTSYSIEQKEVVVNYAKEFGRNNAAAHFKLNESMVGRWVRASKKWTDNVSRNSKRVGSGRKAFFPEAEKKLYYWIIDQRKVGLAVTYAII